MWSAGIVTLCSRILRWAPEGRIGARTDVHDKLVDTQSCCITIGTRLLVAARTPQARYWVSLQRSGNRKRCQATCFLL